MSGGDPASAYTRNEPGGPLRVDVPFGAGAPAHLLLLAERDGRAVGCALVVVGGTEASIEVGEHVADLDTLSVLPEERGLGLGGRLLEEVYAELRRRGIGELSIAVMEGNDDARRFYARRGVVPYLTFLIGRVPPEAP